MHVTGQRIDLILDYQFQKINVIVSKKIPEPPLQAVMIDTCDRSKYKKAMLAMDKLNASYGRQEVKVAAQGFDRKWKLKNEKLSPCYTTNLSDIMTIIAD